MFGCWMFCLVVENQVQSFVLDSMAFLISSRNPVILSPKILTGTVYYGPEDTFRKPPMTRKDVRIFPCIKKSEIDQ